MREAFQDVRSCGNEMPLYLPGILEPCSPLRCVKRHTTSHNDQSKGEQFSHLGKDLCKCRRVKRIKDVHENHHEEVL